MIALTIANLFTWALQAALLVVVALLTLRFVRLDEPAARYHVLRLVLAIILMVPLCGAWLGPAAGGQITADTSSIAVLAQQSEWPSPSVSGGIVSVWSSAVAWLLVGGIILRLGWTMAGTVRLRALRHAGEPAPADMHAELQALIGTCADIRFVAALGHPVTFGLRTPVVLLPESMRTQPASIHRAVVAHELWHVRRRDWMWTVAEELVRAVCWFHPGVWILLSRIQAAREEVVDQLAVLTTGSRRRYIDALLLFTDARPPVAAPALAHRRHLVHRLVLLSREAAMSSKRIVAATALIVLIVLSTAGYGLLAFPFEQSTGADAGLGAGPGPVEARAQQITPENPIPRRTHSVQADYPPAAAQMQARGTVTVQLTLDESGAVAEARVSAITMTLQDAGKRIALSHTGQSGRAILQGLVGGLPAEGQAAVRGAAEALMSAALRAAREWQYAAPFSGPISFPVVVPVGAAVAASEPRATSDGRGIEAWAAGALRVGGDVRAPAKVTHVNPVYPSDAKAAGVQGVVIIETRIEADGRVGDARVIRSIPMLDQAALDAVKAWQFVPTVVNGEPVPIVMTVTINFTLQ